jgi:cyclic pyranopterin phosphate synthase
VRSRYRLDELPRGDRPAQSFEIRGTGGRVGFIAPLSEPFCEDCSRIRITAAGRIRPCLFSETEFDIAPYTAPGVPDAELSRAIRDAVWHKPAGSQFRDEPFEVGASRRSANTGVMIRSVGG